MLWKLRYRLAAAFGLALGRLASPSTRLLVAGAVQITVTLVGVAAIVLVLDFGLVGTVVASAGVWIVASMAATFAYFVEATSEPDRLLEVSKENVE